MSVPVLFVLLPNVLMLDLAGPAEVLRLAAQVDDPAAVDFDLQYVSPVATLYHLHRLAADGAGAAAADPGPRYAGGAGGLHDERVESHQKAFESASHQLTQWLQNVVAPSAERLVCVCAGALSAARAGLLDGRQCTTHHSLCATLQALAPKARVLENRLYVTDGPVSCSAGITAGIDLMLHLVAELAGPRLACAVARDMVGCTCAAAAATRSCRPG